MDFYTGKRPFRGELPLSFSRKNESEQLLADVCQYNKASDNRGLRNLRSFLSVVVGNPAFSAAKPLLHHLNGGDWVSAVGYAKSLLSHVYETHEEQFVFGQIGAFIKKYPFPAMPRIAEANGLHKFLNGERRNRHLNALMRRRRVGSSPVTGAVGVVPGQMLTDMRVYIHRLLGDRCALASLVHHARWGPGAVVGVGGRFTNFARKFLSEEWTCTPAALPFFLTVAKRLPMFWERLGFRDPLHRGHGIICIDPQGFDDAARKHIRLVAHNKISMARKNCDEDRTIASEPLCNQLLQLGVDGDMKQRLKRFGIDLAQQGPNQLMAREGSLVDLGNRYCTIDLTNASGSIYTELVRELVPPEWFLLLNSLRSPAWKYKGGREVKYHGFASMGNGFCFPLETIIFAAICSAVHAYCGTAPDFRVYGDDIIIRQNEALVVLEVLRSLGFKANADKTHIIGPFRESCGADWHCGKPVRPVYVDDDLGSFENIVRTHNALARLPNEWAGPLSNAVARVMPSFAYKFVRPFGCETDEAIDGRHWHGPRQGHYLWNKTHRCPAWYGLSFTAKADRTIGKHAQYHTALFYGALSGSDSITPFAERRETIIRVARFSHWGGDTVAVLPCELTAISSCKRTVYA